MPMDSEKFCRQMIPLMKGILYNQVSVIPFSKRDVCIIDNIYCCLMERKLREEFYYMGMMTQLSNGWIGINDLCLMAGFIVILMFGSDRIIHHRIFRMALVFLCASLLLPSVAAAWSIFDPVSTGSNFATTLTNSAFAKILFPLKTISYSLSFSLLAFSMVPRMTGNPKINTRSEVDPWSADSAE